MSTNYNMLKGEKMDGEVDKMFTKKVDLDFIPGLDDEIKVFLPGTQFFSLIGKICTKKSPNEKTDLKVSTFNIYKYFFLFLKQNYKITSTLFPLGR